MDSMFLSMSQDIRVRWITQRAHFWCSITMHHGQSLHNEIIVHELDSIRIVGSRRWLLYILVRSNIRILRVMVEWLDPTRFNGWQQDQVSSIMSSWRLNLLEWVAYNMLYNSGSISRKKTRWQLQDIRRSLVRISLKFYSTEVVFEWLPENSRIYEELRRHSLL